MLANQNAASGTRPKRILLVDNPDLALEIESEVLQRSGFEIFTAHSGEEALVLVKEHRPDLIFLQTEMPTMSGLVCCQHLKRDAQFRSIPVILMVSDETADTQQRCFEANCEDIFYKPLDSKKIQEKIIFHLDLKVRKLSRLALKVPVEVERSGDTWVAESVNCNREGILIALTEPIEPGINYRLRFQLPGDPAPIQVWSRLERQVLPNSEKNPTSTYLAIFRFLNLDDSTLRRIDGSAKSQTLQAGAAPGPHRERTDLEEVQKVLANGIETYRPWLDTLLKDQRRGLDQIPEALRPLVLQMFASLKAGEKKHLNNTMPEAEAVNQCLALRLKLLIDLRCLEGLPRLSPDEQNTLRGIQSEYFKLPEKIMDTLQNQINLRMQKGELEAMKELNQTKTETFRNFVALKSLINRILDPSAAAQAAQFQIAPSETDDYRVTAYERPKPVEDLPKPKEIKRSQSAPARPIFRTLKILALIILIGGGLPGVYWWLKNANRFIYSSPEIPSLQTKFNTPLPIEKVKDSKGLLMVFLKPDWTKLNFDQKQKLAREFLAEVKNKGYHSIRLYNAQQDLEMYSNSHGEIQVLRK